MPSKSKTSKNVVPDENPPGVFELEQILGYEKRGHQDFYHVKWLGYGFDDATWEPRKNILDPSDEMLEKMKSLKEEFVLKQQKSSAASIKTANTKVKTEVKNKTQSKNATGPLISSSTTHKRRPRSSSASSSDDEEADKKNKKRHRPMDSPQQTKDTIARRSSSSPPPTELLKNSTEASSTKSHMTNGTSKPQAEEELNGILQQRTKQNEHTELKESPKHHDAREDANRNEKDEKTSEKSTRKSVSHPDSVSSSAQLNGKTSSTSRKSHDSHTGTVSAFSEVNVRIKSIRQGENKKLTAIVIRPVVQATTSDDDGDSSAGCKFEDVKMPIEEARKSYPQALLDFLLDRIQIRSDPNATRPPSH